MIDLLILVIPALYFGIFEYNNLISIKENMSTPHHRPSTQGRRSR